MSRARVESSGCLRREYLEKEDGPATPRSKRLRCLLRSAVSFYGHQLSSLYRRIEVTSSWLIFRNLHPSSF